MERATGNDVVVGVDVGTTSTKACAYDVSGALLTTANVATAISRSGGAVEQDPAELLRSVEQSIAQTVAAMNVPVTRVKALALTGQMAGVLGIDENWDPVTNYDSWLDGRCADHLRQLSLEHAGLLVERTGCPPMLDHAPKMQWWRDCRPETYAGIAKFVMPAVYAAGRLAGLHAADAYVDPTYLHFSGAADARTGTWARDLIALLGLDAEKLPTIVESQEVVGRLTPKAAQRCGLPAGTPIVAGMGDTAAGALGAGLLDVGTVLDTAGTAAVLCGVVPDFRPDTEQGLILMRGLPAQHWLTLNYVAGAGLCLPWLAAQFSPSADTSNAEFLQVLLTEAADVQAGSDGLRFLPHVEGRITPSAPGLRGGWVGLGLAHTRAHMVRAVLEAIALEYATYLRSMRRLYPEVEFTGVRAIGGGARSAVWNSIKADVLGLPVTRVPLLETATRGAALLAGAGVGLIDLHQAVEQVPTMPAVEPDPQRHARYAELIEEHISLVDMFAQRANLQSTTTEASLLS